MIELFFVTCLVGEPDICQDHSLLFEERNGIFSCMLRGQNELAQWVERHPDERVQEWKCRYAGEGERSA